LKDHNFLSTQRSLLPRRHSWADQNPIFFEWLAKFTAKG
jgi:hypothetical protein